MAARAGDRIVMRAKTKRVAPSARTGVIEEVLSEAQPRFLVRWDDGRTTVVAPLPDAYSIQRSRAKRARKEEEAEAPAAPGSVKSRSAPRRTKVRKN